MCAQIKKSFVRERQIYSHEAYKEVDVFGYTGTQQDAARRKRGGRKNITPPKQRDLNDRRAQKYLRLLVEANFGKGDYVAHLSYDDQYLPATYEQSICIARNYLRRVDRLYKARGLPNLRYVCVTQWGEAADGTHRIHHHIVLSGGISRDELEALWWAVKGTAGQEDIPYGYANVDNLRPNRKGLAQLSGYISRASAGKKRWTQSQHLKAPYEKRPPNDARYTRHDLERIARMPLDSEAHRKYWERQYRGWQLVECARTYNELTGWQYALRLRKPTGRKTKPAKEGLP